MYVSYSVHSSQDTLNYGSYFAPVFLVVVPSHPQNSVHLNLNKNEGVSTKETKTNTQPTNQAEKLVKGASVQSILSTVVLSNNVTK